MKEKKRNGFFAWTELETHVNGQPHRSTVIEHPGRVGEGGPGVCENLWKILLVGLRL